MTTRNLDALFAPDSVALYGASERPGALGTALLDNLRKDFAGTLLPVNPKYRRLGALRCWSETRDLPETPDLAVIATPPATVPGLIEDLVRRGTRAACIVTAGVDGVGPDTHQRMLDAARPGLLRIVGPNCLGLQVPGHGLNASFAHLFPAPGSIAFVAQSGAMITSVLDWACPRGIGFSHTVSLGDMLDVDFGDLLDYLASDRQTSAILLYVEAITNARKFMSAARAAASGKPVIVVKSGRHAAGARAASSHTGALAGNDAVYDAAFRRAGMLRVFTLEALFDAVETLTRAQPPRGDRLAILTNGGGIGVLAADALADRGGELAVLSDATRTRLDEVMPPGWSRANPVDIVGDADGTRYRAALEILLNEPQADAILIMNCPTAMASPEDCAQAVVDALGAAPQRTVLCNWIGAQSAAAPRELLRRHGLPVYESPDDAVGAFAQMLEYRRNQAQLIETPPSLPTLFEPDQTRAQDAIRAALDAGRSWLSAQQVNDVLGAYGIATVPIELAETAEAAGAIAARLDGRVALKIESPDITHKSDVAGVMLDVAPAQAAAAAAALLTRVAAARPAARLTGVTVQPMVHRPGAQELIAGMFNDTLFGPVLLFGHGGIAVELVNDRALALPPLNLKLARELIARTRVARLLAGYRDVAAADIDALALLLVRLSHLVVACPQIEELDINPLLADAGGVVALDARVRVVATDQSGAARLAIRPYPKELEEVLQTADGRELLLRPIVPEDKPALQAGFAQLTPEQVRFRFFMPMKLLDDVTAARFSQIDYNRQMALVLTEPGVPGSGEIFGVVRLFESPGRERAEFSIVLVGAVSGMGLGTLMMERIIGYARARGIGELRGDVLADNARMLSICRRLGFTLKTNPNTPGTMQVTLPLP